MFERFTDRARRVVVFAQEEARLLNHNYIGTEHILLGIVHEGEGVGAKALEVMRISLEAVRHQVEEIIGLGGSAPAGHIPFTPRAKKVLELSLREALQLGHDYIGTEHILLGLLREGEGVGAQVLVKLGADLARVRQVIVELLSGQTPTLETRPPAPSGPGQIIFAQQFASPTCSFCGRDLWEVDRYVAGVGAVICDGCVATATDAVAGASTREVRLPPRLFGDRPHTATDPVDIENAFAAVFGTTERPDRASFLEDGEAILAFLSTVQAQLPPVEVRRVVIHGMRFTGADAADVRFALQIGPGPGAVPFVGRAIRSGSGWQVSRETFAELVARSGIRIPPDDPARGPTGSPGESPPPAP